MFADDLKIFARISARTRLCNAYSIPFLNGCEAKDIRDPLCLKGLYWSTNAASILRVERVQRNFTRIAVRRFLGRTHAHVPPYPVRCRLLDLQSLRDRRSIAQALIVSGLLRNDIDSPMLRSEIPIHALSCGLR